MATEQQRVYVRSGDRTGEGVLHVAVYGPQERMRRAAVAWGVAWGLALLSIPIPIAHFVLVPGFLIAGPVVGFLRYRRERSTERLTGTCPACGRDFGIVLQSSEEPPLRSYCPHCQAPLEALRELPEPGAPEPAPGEEGGAGDRPGGQAGPKAGG